MSDVRLAADRMCKVAYLTAYLDTLLRIGAIPEQYAQAIRETIDKTREAFALPELGKREKADA